MARYARGYVIRPLRLFGALAIAGVIGAVLTFSQLPVPRAFLAMSTCLALAFSVNRRVTRPPRWPALRRGAWIGAAALMLAAIPSDVPPERGVGAVSFAMLGIDLAVIAAIACVVLAMGIRIARGIAADRGDRLLVGALAGLVLFAWMWLTATPWPPPEWSYSFWLLLGAADARAYGNIRRP